jgi:hypothetical protein
VAARKPLVCGETHALSFKDADALQRFRQTRRFPFAVELSDLPADRFELKAHGAAIARVGASGQGGFISCDLTHGERYTQKLSDGKIDTPLLAPRTGTIQAPTRPLLLAGPDFEDEVLSTPQRLEFWGRGLAGQYELTIPQSEIDLHAPDLSGLTELEVWLAYQFTR